MEMSDVCMLLPLLEDKGHHRKSWNKKPFQSGSGHAILSHTLISYGERKQEDYSYDRNTGEQ